MNALLELIRHIEQREAVQVFQKQLLLKQYNRILNKLTDIEIHMSLQSDLLRKIAADTIASQEALLAFATTSEQNQLSLTASVADLTAKLAAAGVDPDLVQAATDVGNAMSQENVRTATALAALIAGLNPTAPPVTTDPPVPTDPPVSTDPPADPAPKQTDTPAAT